MARPQPYRAARIQNRDKTVTIRLRKSSSPSRWLMGLPPTSPRLKFVHTHPGGSPVPRRPPRHPPSPSTRSRSLELLDQDEKKSSLPVALPEPLPRPRSRSLDGLLDEDGIMPETKSEEPSKQKIESKCELNRSAESPDRRSYEKPEKIGLVRSILERMESQKASEEQTRNAPSETSDRESPPETKSNDDQSPTLVPRLKLRTPVEEHTSEVKVVEHENARISSSSEDASDKEEYQPTRPPKPVRYASVDAQSVNTSSGKNEDTECESTVRPCDSNVGLMAERLMVTGNDKSTLLKARSCGAGLDSDGSVSSNEYKPKVKGQGSLLSLPSGAEPKRKKNFMDKCVNKVRSFMRK